MGSLNVGPESSAQRYVVLALCGLVYAVTYLQRVMLAPITDAVQKHFGTDIAGVGTLSSCFFYTYSIAQPVVGLMVDATHARWTMIASCLVIFAGSLVTGFVRSLAAGYVGRALVGLGCAPVYVTAIKYASIYLSPERFVFCPGILAACAGLAGIIGSAPLKHLTDAIGFTWVCVGIGGTAFIPGILIACLGQYTSISAAEMGKASLQQFKAGLAEMFHNRGSLFLIPLMLYYFFFSGGSYTISSCLGAAFIVNVNPEISSTYASWMFTLQSVGLVIGGVAMPFISRYTGRKPPHLVASGLIALIMLAFALIGEADPPGWAFGILYTFYGLFTACASSVGYSMCKELVSVAIASTVIGVFNFFPALGGAIFQNTLPLIIRHNPDGGYRIVGFIMTGQYALAMFIAIFLKETSPCTSTCIRSQKHRGQREVQPPTPLTPENDNAQTSMLLDVRAETAITSPVCST
ncbi:Sugar transport family protein [Giardia muris]|uniref:Lysosomal dipeptide transporter MFSD1 n=1 Tax=Giardia muris TaxID=5742 RepID=A0A4Z1SLJ0_GIAMU|nr:Sugar transport family protein [Giardia muris]|eukprot:TNJ26390.1 Sugar transport family protein [Giardia muris]